MVTTAPFVAWLECHEHEDCARERLTLTYYMNHFKYSRSLSPLFMGQWTLLKVSHAFKYYSFLQLQIYSSSQKILLTLSLNTLIAYVEVDTIYQFVDFYIPILQGVSLFVSITLLLPFIVVFDNRILFFQLNNVTLCKQLTIRKVGKSMIQ